MFAAGRERWESASLGCHKQVVAVRSDERGSLPSLAFSLLAQETFVRDRPFLERRSVDLTAIGDIQPARTAEPRGRGAEWLDQLTDELVPAQRDARGEPHELTVPERDLVQRERHLLPRRAQERVALLKYAREFSGLASVRAFDLREHRVEVPAARIRGRPKKIDVLWKERDHHELSRDVVHALTRAIEQVAPWTAALTRGRREQHDLEAAMAFRAVHLHSHPTGRRPPAHELRVVVCAWGISAGGDVDRLEKIRLAGAVRADEGGDASTKRKSHIRVRTKVLEPKISDSHAAGLGRDAEWHHDVEVAVVPDDLDDARRQRTAELECDLGRGDAAESVRDEA